MTRQTSLFISSLVVLSILSGCGLTGFEIDDAIEKYNAKAGAVKIGDSKEKVLSLLQPTQATLSLKTRKPAEAFTDTTNGTVSVIEIYYFRSNRIADDRLTDDEFTPYVFRDGSLVSIGWTALGGPKVLAPSPPPQTQTRIAVEQTPPHVRQPMTCIQTGPVMNCQ